MLVLATLLLGLEPRPAARAPPRPQLSRRAALVGGALAATSCARPASAAYGPAGAAVTSAPNVVRINIDEWLALPADKVVQRIGSLSEDRLRLVREQLEDKFDQIKLDGLNSAIDLLETDTIDYNGTSTYKELVALRAQAEKTKLALVLARQLREREMLLKQLEAQPPWVAYGAAALASLGSTLVMHPVDTFKTMQIAQSGGERPAGGGAAAAAAAPPPAPAPLPPLGDLYVGLLPNLLKEAPSSALYLGIYEIVRAALMAPGAPCERTPLLAYLVAGAVGELVGSVIRAPAEATKSRVQSGLAASPAEAFSQVLLSSSGRERTLTAWGASLWRDVPMGAVQIAVFELLKAYCVSLPEFSAQLNTLPAEAAFGAIGGLVGAVLTCPGDVVVTRIITSAEGGAGDGGGAEGGAGAGGSAEGGASAVLTTAPHEAGPLEVARSILAEAGPAGFFVGVRSRALYWAPAIGIFLSLYCSFRQASLGF